MDIVIVTQYLRNIESLTGNNSRFIYLAKLLVKNGNEVEIITSDFYHSTKRHFQRTDELPGIKITMQHEPGYKKNISLKRFASHKELGRNIGRYLKHRKNPDLVYCAVPSLDVARQVARFCAKEKVKFVIDIQDLWPEAFKMVVNIPVISDIAFMPMKYQANRIYQMADKIVAVSETYASRARLVNKKCLDSRVVYLGTEKKNYDHVVPKSEISSDLIKIAYVGSMSASYDLNTVIDAISQMPDHANVRLVAMGDGSLKEQFMKYAEKRGIQSEFTGRLPYFEMIEKLKSCDIAVNPIKKGSAGSIINKVGDYAMAGLPVVSTQESEEYRILLDEYKAGINCKCESVDEVSEALELLFKDENLRKIVSENSLRLGKERFDREKTYQEIIDYITN